MPTRTDPAIALEAILASDVSSVDAEAAATALGDVGAVRGFIDRYEASVTSQINRMHGECGGAPAAEVHARTSGVSAAEARRKERRAKALEAASAFGDDRDPPQ